MSHPGSLPLATAFLAAASVLTVARPVLPAPPPAPLRLSSLAVNMSGIGRTDPQRVEIVLERWSTDAERAQLIETLKKSGSDALLDALQKVKPRAGYIRTTTSLGWDLQFARAYDLPKGGYRIVFATDRPMGFYEIQNNTRSSDYEFMFCEIRVGPDGRGEGKLVPAARITFDKGEDKIEIENYGTEPVRLNDVRVELDKKDK